MGIHLSALPITQLTSAVCALVSLKAALGIFFFSVREDKEPDPMD